MTPKLVYRIPCWLAAAMPLTISMKYRSTMDSLRLRDEPAVVLFRKASLRLPSLQNYVMMYIALRFSTVPSNLTTFS